MQDHELAEYHRLRSEGRWTAANEFRESERKRLRAAGRTRQQAREESFQAMLEKFPPLEEQTPSPQPPVPPEVWDYEDEDDSDFQFDDYRQNPEISKELEQLVQRTEGQPIDTDRDIAFAYRVMALPNVRPSMAPNSAAWHWYLYARKEPHRFLEIVAKREDAKAKSTGTSAQQRMEDDKRKQFAILDRIAAQLQMNLDSTIDELMTKFPFDTLQACRRHEEAWYAFLKKNP